MKCPKCGYLGFEHVERCRNCGYDFSLSQSVALPDLPMRPDAADEGCALDAVDDLTLIDAGTHRAPARGTQTIDADLDRVFGAPEPEPAPPASRRPRNSPGSASMSPSEELSLFGSSLQDDQPLITRASPPRQPLAVRRATPEAPRLRSDPSRTPSLDLGLELDLDDVGDLPGSSSADWDAPGERAEVERARLGARVFAAAIDLLILATIDIAVVYFTMQICGVGLWDLGIVPKVPLLAFLLVQNGGYLVAFTVGGQTLGKMAAGIRVVPSDSTDTVDVGRAVLRTLVWFALAVPAGLGFLSALFSRDRRGLHDRFAGTRVVRASA